MQPELSVIIVNYNGYSFLDDFLFSLRDKLVNIRHEVIVIDNNSTDQSVSHLKANHPDVILIESKRNHGFGKGNNEAVKLAKGDYLLLINNDTIVLDDLSEALGFLKADESVGIVGINMLDGNRNYIPSCGNFPNFKNMFQMKRLNFISEEFKTGRFSGKYYEVDWIGGAFLLIPRKVYLEVGGFDERYFLYVEDVDLSKMIADRGYKRVFIPSFRYIHFVGFNKKKNPLLVKGYEIYIDKHYTGTKKLFVTFALATNKLVKYLKNTLGLG